jgi:outer membrane protein OmpA-like peptidoglycan-associated protein
VLDTSFVHAVANVQRLEGGHTWYEKVSEPAGVEAVAPGLWARLDSLQRADVNRCAESELARAQVKLLLAVEEHRTGGTSCSGPVVQDVESLMDEIRRLIAACEPKAEADSAPVPAPVAPPAESEAPARVRVPGEVHFAFDRATLSPATRRVLDQVAAQLVALPDAQIRLDAFTDPVGTASYNRRLSARRGEAVRKHLVSKGVDPARITVVPLGASVPLEQGVTLRERYALERRVDIQVLTMPDIVIERYEQRADLQPTPEQRRPSGRTRPSSRDQGK